MEKISMVDLSAQFAAAYSYMNPTPEQILESGQYIGGLLVTKFEKAWAKYCGVKHAVGISSGTDALTACFMALVDRWGGPRMRVITQANTFVATANAALRVPGMTVEFIDCDEYFGMSACALRARILSWDADKFDLTIVVPVHMYGGLCDMQAIVRLVNRYDNVFLVEDASHAHGSCDLLGRRAGSYGDLAAFSCFPTKPLGAAGDAGIVTTNQESYAENVRSYINVGRGTDGDVHDKIGFTYRLDAIQAGILWAKLQCLDGWRARKERLAQRYFEAWKDLDEVGLELPYLQPTCRDSAWYAFPLRVWKSKRQKLQDHLFEKGIPSKRYYPKVVPDAAWLAIEARLTAADDLGMARQFCEEIVCIPLHEWLVEEQWQYIIQEVREGLAGG